MTTDTQKIALIIAATGIWSYLVFRQIKTGKAISAFGISNKSDDPGGYWLSISGQIVIVVLILLISMYD